MARCNPNFRVLLRDYDLEHLDRQDAAAFGMWSDLTLAYHNDAWDRFAAENNGQPGIAEHWGLGSVVTDAISEPLRSFYLKGYRRCLETGEPWEHCYQCSSATTYREFRARTCPLGDAEGLLSVHSLVVERPHDPVDRPPQPAEEDVYLDGDGFLRQCCHCRRMRRSSDHHQWDWVPQWVERQPQNTSHTICPICLACYYAPKEDEPATVEAG
jgi:hypothetical protein